MTPQAILDQVKAHPAGKVKIAITDMDGILRGKYISKDNWHQLL
jgi:glutamine synthetase